MATPSEWITLTVKLHPDMADVVANFCHEHGARGVVIDDDDELLTIITAYFPEESWDAVHQDFYDYMDRLCELFIGVNRPVVQIERLKQENWAIAWKDNFHSIAIGKSLLVTPPWLQPDPQGRHVIVIDPAEAFGTGTHETTQGCLELLEQAMEELKALSHDIRVLDVGCGSGILSIAARKLGATHVLGVDNDPIAIEAAWHDAELSHVSDGINFQCLDLLDGLESADIVTANLDTMTLMAHQEKLIGLARVFLILSGVPLDQWDDLRASFLAQNLTFVNELTRQAWGCGLFRRA
jgi:ribosomal protein L11 methyltransferase